MLYYSEMQPGPDLFMFVSHSEFQFFSWGSKINLMGCTPEFLGEMIRVKQSLHSEMKSSFIRGGCCQQKSGSTCHSPPKALPRLLFILSKKRYFLCTFILVIQIYMRVHVCCDIKCIFHIGSCTKNILTIIGLQHVPGSLKQCPQYVASLKVPLTIQFSQNIPLIIIRFIHSEMNQFKISHQQLEEQMTQF